MAAIEQVEGVYKGSDDGHAPDVATGTSLKALELLADAHELYDYSTPDEISRKEELGAQIAELKRELSELRAKSKQRREESERLSNHRATFVRRRLRDPSSAYHEVYRAILINAEEAGGSLENRSNFAEAHSLGSKLVGLNHYLEGSVEPQPLVVVRNIPTEDVPTPNLQLDYGYSSPGIGIELFTEGEATAWKSNLRSENGPQLWLGLTAVDMPPMHSVMQSSHNSHFVGDDRKVVRVDDGGYMLEDTLAVDDIVPAADKIVLPLPVGNLYTARPQKPFIVHDLPDGSVERIYLPGNFQGLSRDKIVLLGSNAISQVFELLPIHIESILGEEKGRVTKAMTTTVARDEFRFSTDN